MRIDLNCDLGEGAGQDHELMSLITSANICCGAHAGSAQDSRIALSQAKAGGVQVGAHPGYPDRESFGRNERQLDTDWGDSGLEMALMQLQMEVSTQVRALIQMAEAVNLKVSYIKPHGGLYNQAARDERIALALVEVAELLELPLMGLPGTALETAAQGCVGFIREGFADRRYRSDGTLVARSEPGAFVHTVEEAVDQAKRLLHEGFVQTLCVHGDNPQALAFVRSLRQALLDDGVSIQPFDVP